MSTTAQAKQELQEAALAIAMAADLLRPHLDLFERFDTERRDLESFGHIVDPTLYRDPEKRAVSALLAPLFIGAQNFVRIVDVQTKHAAAALAKVR